MRSWTGLDQEKPAEKTKQEGISVQKYDIDKHNFKKKGDGEKNAVQ